MRAGLPGAFAAWLGFTAPSALVMIVFGYGVTEFGDLSHAAWLHGLKIVAVAVVAQAVWGMARNLCPDRERATIAVGAAILALALPSAAGQIGAIVAGAQDRRLVVQRAEPIGQRDRGGALVHVDRRPDLEHLLPARHAEAEIGGMLEMLVHGHGSLVSCPWQCTRDN